MYADNMTGSMQRAIAETNRRRKIQDDYNKAHGIVPKTVIKGIRDVIDIGAPDSDGKSRADKKKSQKKLTSTEREKLIEKLTREMKDAARTLEFEKAAYLRDEIKKLREG